MTDLSTPCSTRLCLSGLESRRLLETFADFGVRHIQVSYYYLSRVFSDPAEFESFAAPFSTVIIDSGTVYHKFKTEEEKTSFIGEYSAYISALDKKAYTAAVMEEGASIKGALGEEALIYPLDDIRKVFDDDWNSLCRNIEYVGVGNKFASKNGGDDIAPLINAARKHGTKIHLFGTSSKRILQKYPIYSANSSSWRSGSRYLNTYIYEGPSRGYRLYQPSDKSDPIKTERELTTLRRRQENMVKVRQAPLYEKINWSEVYEGDAWEVDKANLTQWMLYAQDLELAPHKAYWLTDEDKKKVLERKQAVLSKTAESIILPKGSEEDAKPEKTSDQKLQGIECGGDIQPAIEDPNIGGPNNQGGSLEDAIEGEIVEDAIVVDDNNEPNIAPLDISAYRDVTEELTDNNPLETGVGSTPASTPQSSAEIVAKSGLGDLLPAPPSGSERLKPVDPRMSTLRQCDFCILQGRCPKYEPGANCSYGLPPEDPAYNPTQLERHVMEDMGEFLAIQKDRIMQAYLEEKMDASGLSKDLGKELERYVTMVNLLSEATDKRDTLKVEAKGQGLLDVFLKKN